MNYWAAPEILTKTIVEKTVENDEINILINKVCNFYGIEHFELMSKRRLRTFVDARNTLYYILNRCYKLTFTDIANRFNKNHATIISGANRIEGFMQFDKVFKNQINNLVNIEIIKYS